MQVYGWQTFKRIGASRVMNRAYRLVLAFSINLQVALYFFVTSTVMWVDALLNGPVARFAEHASIYKGVFITSILVGINMHCYCFTRDVYPSYLATPSLVGTWLDRRPAGE